MKGDTTPMLFPYEPEELFQKIRELLHSELIKFLPESKQQVSYEVNGLTQKPLYKADEVCAMFHITRQTLHEWGKEGIVKPYKIKSRVFYLWNDLEKLITPTQTA